MKYDIRKLMGLVEEQHSIPNVTIEPESAQRVKNRVMSQINAKSRRRPLRFALTALAAAMALTMTAFAADFVINERKVFILDTIESYVAAYQQAHPHDDGIATEAPGSLSENQELLSSTAAEDIALYLEFGYPGEETVISDEIGSSEDEWDRKKVTEFDHPFYDCHVVSEYTTGAFLASRISIPELVDWDISCLTEDHTPHEDAQLLIVTRDASSGEIVEARYVSSYEPDDGGNFFLNFKYDPLSANSDKLVLSSESDLCELYTTSDNVEVLLESYEGQIWVSALNTHGRLNIYCYGPTVDEMKDLLDHMNLAVLMEAFG